ncbi:MAG: bifunctional histidinol-phosphatase/imidazoleglycerol-phosphate dehydratase, partial [Mucinivorans sp.]
MRKVIFVDRDGTIIIEPPVDFQIDSLEKLEFIPRAISALSSIRELDFELVMASNQDGLGTASFPEQSFWTAHDKMLRTLEGEGVVFDACLIDRSFEAQNSPSRKPRTG